MVALPEGSKVLTTGLSTVEAAHRLRRDGPNALPTPERAPTWTRLAAQMVHFFALLFWVAGVLAFVQEERAEHAAERLRDLIVRAFGVLGPTEAVVSLTAFVVTFVATGWRLGDTFPEGQVLLAASGAAFAAIVLGQVANAFACRSTVRPAWKVPLRANSLLLVGVAVEVVLLLVFLYVPPIADLLDQSGPTVWGFAVAALAMPAVLVVDAIHKRTIRARRDARLTMPGS